MAITGFNPQTVTEAVSKVNAQYAELMNTIYNGVQKTFIEGMADKWASAQAQSFFAAAAQRMNGLCYSDAENVNEIFQSVADAMNTAAMAWADAQNESYTPVAFNPIVQTFNSDSIQENIGGVRGIDLENATQVANTLTTSTLESVSNALDAARNAVAESGFVGGNQQESINGSLDEIKANVTKALNEIAEELKASIAETVNTYGDVAGQVAQAFAGN